MNYYDTVKEKLADYIVKDEVIETEEVISAYTLFSALENCNKRLRHAKETGKGLVDKLNDIYPKEVVKKKGKLFKVKENHFDNYIYSINDNDSKIGLHEYLNGWIYICKDFDYNDIYSLNKSITFEAYNECIHDIYNIFDELEYIGKLFIQDKKSHTSKDSDFHDTSSRNDSWFMSVKNNETINNTIPCEKFDININFSRDFKEFTYSIDLNKDFNPSGNSNRIYYNQENNLNQIIEENKEAILRNTPVKLSDLSYMFFMIVIEYRDAKEKEKEEIQIKKVMDEVKMNED